MQPTKYEVWVSGYAMNGEDEKAKFLGSTTAYSFKEACEKVVVEKGMQYEYDANRNSIWGCRLYDNEQDARKYFG